MKTFTTPKGTELPFLNLKGKDYLLVPHRVLWMREEHPEWSIESETLQLTENIAIIRATIRNEQGKIIAQGTKSETPEGFAAGYIEKAETGAIGRALAFCGYGTQFAQELETGDHVADAPISPTKPNGGQPPQPSSESKSISSAKKEPYYEVTFGKFKGQNIYSIPLNQVKDYANHLIKSANENKKPLTGPAKEFVDKVKEMAGLPVE